MLHTRHQPRRRARRVHRKTLRLLLRIWASQHSGVLTTQDGPVRFQSGEPCTSEDLRLAVRTLDNPEAPDPRFARSRATGEPPVPVMAHTLWKAGLRLAERHPLPQSGRLIPTPAERRLAAFPISRRTRAFLDESTDLGELIRMSRPDRQAIRQELQVLVTIGVYRLPKAPTAAPPDPKTRERLEKEVRRLRGADCWTVLGTRDETRIARASDRLERRYTKLLKDADPRVRTLARQLLDQMRRALMEARTGRTPRRTHLDQHNAFDVGLRELQAGNYSDAVKAFARVKQAQPFNGRVLAWLGYALMYDPSFPKAKRLNRGRRFLEQAESMGNHRGDADLLLARLDIADGDLRRARTRLDRAARRHPANADVRVLLERLRKGLKS